MNIDVPYRGYSAVPSDYDCTDGDLAASLNLIPEDGAVHAIMPPLELCTLSPGTKILGIHTVSGPSTHYIAYNHVRKCLLWFDSDNDFAPHDIAGTVANCPTSITATGNILMVLCQGAPLDYYIWRDNSYAHLGTQLPEVQMQFGLQQFCNLGVDTVEFPVTEEMQAFLSKSMHQGGSGTHAPTSGSYKDEVQHFRELLSDAVYGTLFKVINDRIDEKGLLFYQPFFIRYALRLFDGTYVRHSAPILMLPSSVPPWVIQSTPAVSDNIYRCNISYIHTWLYQLTYRTLNIADLTLYKDIIASLDIFISQPLYSFDQSEPITRASGNITFSTAKGNNSIRGRQSSTPYEKLTDRIDGFYAIHNDNYKRHIAQPPNDSSYFVFPYREKKLNAAIESCHDFYLVASIPFDEIKATTDLAPLPIKEGITFSSLPTQQTLPDDFISHAIVCPKGASGYNARTHLVDNIVHPPLFHEIRTVAPFVNPTDFASGTSYVVDSCVHLRKNGTEIRAISTHQMPTDRQASPAVADSFIDNLPLYLFYPDPDAYSVDFRITRCSDGTAVYKSFQLRPHDFLHGAYCFRGFNIPADGTVTDSEQPTHIWDTTDNLRAGYTRPSTLYVSEVNNPFVYPARFAVSIDGTRIDAISSAAKALSQGQFGQFPLYAFTDHGVWALQVSADGTYSARQPITRDVCLSPAGIAQLDSSVVFATRRGLMLLSGSSAQCISDAVNNVTTLSLLGLPHITEIHNKLAHTASDDNCLEIQPFADFLQNASMIYDYAHQSIIVHSTEATYAYVYSLKTNLWGMIYSEIAYGVNSYPAAIAVDANRRLLDFSRHSNSTVRGMLVTRPIKLGAPDIHKTIDCIITRGCFHKGHVQTLLYGSRDLYSWQLIWSSRDHYLRGFHGTPYKYYRIALFCELDADESISGASLQFTPRLTNQPR